MKDHIDDCREIPGYDWAVEISCAPFSTLTDQAFREIGAELVDYQLVLIKNQKGMDPRDFRRMCHVIGDTEGYNYGDGSIIDDDTVSPDGRTRRQLYLDYVVRDDDGNPVPGVMRVTGMLKKDGGPSGIFGHDKALDWHCNKPSLAGRHSYVSLLGVTGTAGSRTTWLDMSQAYEDLPEGKREYYKTLRTVCGFKSGGYSDHSAFVDHISYDTAKPLVKEKFGKTGLFFPPYQTLDFILPDGTSVDNFKEEQSYLEKHVLNEKYMYHLDFEDGAMTITDQDITIHKRHDFAGMKNRLCWRAAHGIENMI